MVHVGWRPAWRLVGLAAASAAGGTVMSLINIMQSRRGLDRWVENCLLPGGGFVPGESGIWLMNEPEGSTIVKDYFSVLNGNFVSSIQNNSKLIVNDEINLTTYFDGVNYATLGAVLTDFSSNEATISAWVKFESGGDSWSTIFSKGHSNLEFQFRNIDIAPTMYFFKSLNGGNTYEYTTRPSGVDPYVWQNYTVTFGLDKGIRFYSNSILVGSRTMETGFENVNTASNAYIGARSASKCKLKGSLALLTYSPVAWSAERIKMLYETATKGV